MLVNTFYSFFMAFVIMFLPITQFTIYDTDGTKIEGLNIEDLDNPEDMFNLAVLNTAKEMFKELAAISNENNVEQVFKAIKFQPIEMDMNFKVKEFDIVEDYYYYSYPSFEEFEVDINGKFDPKAGKILTESSIVIPKELLEKDADLELNFSFYSDDEQIGVKIPDVSDTYYKTSYADISKLIKMFNNDEYILEYWERKIEYLKDAMKNCSDENILYNEAFSVKSMMPYLEILRNTFEKGLYQAEEDTDIEYASGKNVTANKISVTFEPDVLNEFVQNIADQIREDKNMYSLYDKMYSKRYAELSAIYMIEQEEDFTQELLDGFADLVEWIEFDYPVTYTIYTDDNLILMREITFFADKDLEDSYIFRVYTNGDEYLINNLIFETVDTYGKFQDRVKFEIGGNIVPKNGVSNAEFSLETYEVYFEDSEEYNYVLFKGNYSYDRNKSSDNFSLSIVNGENEQEDYYTAVTFDVNGTILADLKEKLVDINLDSIKLISELGNKEFCFRLKITPIDAEKIRMTESRNIQTMTLDEIINLIMKFKSVYEID